MDVVFLGELRRLSGEFYFELIRASAGTTAGASLLSPELAQNIWTGGGSLRDAQLLEGLCGTELDELLGPQKAGYFSSLDLRKGSLNKS